MSNLAKKDRLVNLAEVADQFVEALHNLVFAKLTLDRKLGTLLPHEAKRELVDKYNACASLYDQATETLEMETARLGLTVDTKPLTALRPALLGRLRFHDTDTAAIGAANTAAELIRVEARQMAIREEEGDRQPQIVPLEQLGQLPQNAAHGEDEGKPAKGKSDGPIPVAKTESGSVLLFDRHDGPIVNGNEKPTLTNARYDVVFALLQTDDKGLTKDERDRESRRGDARKILKRLSDADSDWQSVISFPGTTGKGYRIM